MKLDHRQRGGKITRPALYWIDQAGNQKKRGAREAPWAVQDALRVGLPVGDSDAVCDMVKAKEGDGVVLADPDGLPEMLGERLLVRVGLIDRVYCSVGVAVPVLVDVREREAENFLVPDRVGDTLAVGVCVG